jgi:hypothetical protein
MLLKIKLLSKGLGKMEKKVGNLLLFLLLASKILFASDAAIILRMQDMNHKPIDQAMCQAPFILQIELVNLEGYSDSRIVRDLNGLDNFKTSKAMTKSHAVSIDNGKKITKVLYDFVLRSDKKGTFTVGPLYLNDQYGKSIKSNRLIIPVADEVVSSSTNQAEKYFLKISFDKQQAYVGEKIKLKIQFYDRLFVDDLHLKFPDFQNIYIVKNQKNVKKSMMIIENQEYSVTEWTFDIYATQAGAMIMQDITAAFFAPELSNRFTFGGAFDFFRSLHKAEQYIVANPIKIDILPLPKNKDFPHIHAVGQFSKFEISVQQNQAQVGQGITLTTDLFGDGNFEIMDKISLALPENFNYYDSNIIVINEQRNHKHCEFIVQANKDGEYQIQPQNLLYFDPVEGVYKKLESNTLDITILPCATPIHTADIADEALHDTDEPVVKELHDFKVMSNNRLHAVSKIMIPQNLFYHILFMLVLLWILLFLYRARLFHYIIESKKIMKWRIFLQAYKKCKRAQTQKDFVVLHDLFTQLFAQLLQRHVGQLHDADMINYLIDRNFSLQQIDEWKLFYHKILQASFSTQQKDQQSQLFDQAFVWISLLKGKA